MQDPAGRIAAINAGQAAALELGSGPVRARPGYVTVDLRELPTVDVRGDVFEVLAALADDSVTGIYASHFIEHVEDLDRLLAELVRVCRPGATIELVAPHFSNAFFYSDHTHRAFFGLYTFCYLARSDAGFKRQVPDYSRIPGLVLRDVKLRFKSYRPYYVRHAFRRLVEKIVNATRYTRELYEEGFTGFVSCYEVEYHLTVEPVGAPRPAIAAAAA